MCNREIAYREDEVVMSTLDCVAICTMAVAVVVSFICSDRIMSKAVEDMKAVRGIMHEAIDGYRDMSAKAINSYRDMYRDMLAFYGSNKTLVAYLDEDGTLHMTTIDITDKETAEKFLEAIGNPVKEEENRK